MTMQSTEIKNERRVGERMQLLRTMGYVQVVITTHRGVVQLFFRSPTWLSELSVLAHMLGNIIVVAYSTEHDCMTFGDIHVGT